MLANHDYGHILLPSIYVRNWSKLTKLMESALHRRSRMSIVRNMTH